MRTSAAAAWTLAVVHLKNGRKMCVRSEIACLLLTLLHSLLMIPQTFDQPMPNPAAEEKKALGNQAFKANNFQKAIDFYSQAISLDPRQHTYWSNRSACYAGINDWANAANDAKECINVEKKFVKGYFRLALAQKNLGQYQEALETIKNGLTVDYASKDLKEMKKEVDNSIRLQKVQGYIDAANQQYSKRDFGNCLNTIENGLRLDAGNPSLTKLQARVQPEFEREEKSRKAGLSPTERLKEQGDELYKAAKFEEAIAAYTKALDKISDKGGDLALKAYANRAACYKQLSNFDGLISDCTSVLEAKPDDVKSLLRRAQAFEAVERYKMAMQDVRQVLALGKDQVGESNMTIANGLQHRLNRVIQQLKSGG